MARELTSRQKILTEKQLKIYNKTLSSFTSIFTGSFSPLKTTDFSKLKDLSQRDNIIAIHLLAEDIVDELTKVSSNEKNIAKEYIRKNGYFASAIYECLNEVRRENGLPPATLIPLKELQQGPRAVVSSFNVGVGGGYHQPDRSRVTASVPANSLNVDSSSLHASLGGLSLSGKERARFAATIADPAQAEAASASMDTLVPAATHRGAASYSTLTQKEADAAMGTFTQESVVTRLGMGHESAAASDAVDSPQSLEADLGTTREPSLGAGIGFPTSTITTMQIREMALVPGMEEFAQAVGQIRGFVKQGSQQIPGGPGSNLPGVNPGRFVDTTFGFGPSGPKASGARNAAPASDLSGAQGQGVFPSTRSIGGKK